jgi:hypothetical protein
MLKAAHAALVEFGALAPSDRLPPFWARMSGNLVLMVYPKDSPFYLVGLAFEGASTANSEGCDRARGDAAQCASAVRLTTQDPFQVLVTLGLHHQQLDLRRGRRL